MIASTLAWLRERPAAARMIALAYLLASVLPHEQVNGWVFALQQALGRSLFLLLCGVLAVVAAGSVLVATRRALVPSPERRLLLLWGALLGTALTIAELGLVSVVSEAVHFLQYALATLLLVPLVGSVGAAMIWATLVGVADEGYQYWVLHRDWGIYLDFNDILLNAIGAALGGWIATAALGLCRRRGAPRHSRMLSRASVIAFLLLLAGSGLVATGRVATSAAKASGASWFVLDRGTPPAAFWSYAEWAEKRYHVLAPGEGAVLLAVAVLLFAAVDAWFEPLAVRAREGTS